MTFDDRGISYSDLLDFVMAEHLALRAFMLSASAEIGRQHADPAAWITEFISTLHARIDVNEKVLGQTASQLPVHEMARKTFDFLGHIRMNGRCQFNITGTNVNLHDLSYDCVAKLSMAERDESARKPPSITAP